MGCSASRLGCSAAHVARTPPARPRRGRDSGPTPAAVEVDPSKLYSSGPAAPSGRVIDASVPDPAISSLSSKTSTCPNAFPPGGRGGERYTPLRVLHLGDRGDGIGC